MEKCDQNGDIEGDTSQSLEVAKDSGKVNGEVIRVKKGASVEEDSVGTGQESDEEFSHPEISRASEYEEEVSVGRVNGKVVEEESDQETEDLVSERQIVDVSESTQDVDEEVIEAVEEIEVTECQETLDEVTQGSEEEAEVSDRESVDIQEDAGPEKRKIEYIEDLELEEEEEEKQDTESVTEEREEEYQEEEEEEEEEEEASIPEEPNQEEDLVDCKPETKEPIQSLKTSAKEHTKTREQGVEEEGRQAPEGLLRRRSSAESFQKLKDRFSNGTKVEENNRKNIEDEQNQGGAKIMSDKNKRFGGTSEKCTQCNRTVYPMEKMEVAGRLLHKTCFKCCKCNSQLSVGRFSIGGKDMYCMTHYKQAFREKGNYDVFTPDNPIKGKWENK
ncbi:uncharacterized protein [Palaemon carinicauda]|uniref:uncharacterized protein n=1 Tax=Palaemon carinicauda TaxID=392227 RepID=UPI0035B59DA6